MGHSRRNASRSKRLSRMHSCNLYRQQLVQVLLHQFTFSNYYQDNCDNHTEGSFIILKYLFIKVSGGTKGNMCKPSGKGTRLIILHARGEDGWIEGADWCFKARSVLIMSGGLHCMACTRVEWD